VKKFNSCNPGRSWATDRRNSRIEGRRFPPRSVVKLRPSGGVGGKTRKKGFIRGSAPRSGRIRFCVALLGSSPRSSLPFSRRGMDSHGTLRRTLCNADTYARARTRWYVQRQRNSPLPRIPTCFRPQAAVITAQSRVVDQKGRREEKRAAAVQRSAPESSSSCTG